MALAFGTTIADTFHLQKGREVVLVRLREKAILARGVFSASKDLSGISGDVIAIRAIGQLSVDTVRLRIVLVYVFHERFSSQVLPHNEELVFADANAVHNVESHLRRRIIMTK